MVRIIVFDRPASLDELGGEMIEQFGMRRRFAGHAEIVDAPRQPLAEQMLPQPVDHHAGGERIVGTRDPRRQFDAAAVIVGNRFRRDRAEQRGTSRAAERRRDWCGVAADAQRASAGCLIELTAVIRVPWR